MNDKSDWLNKTLDGGTNLRIDQSCQELEEQWAAGETPDLQKLLGDETGNVRRRKLFELIKSDRECRVKRGDEPTSEDYLAQFSEDREVIEAVFSSRSNIPPLKIAHYAILEELSNSGQAVVYHATNRLMGTDVAIKVSHRVVQQFVQDRLAREAKLLARLEHPNLARVIDLNLYDGRVYLVMEFVHGVTLNQYHESHQPNPAQAAMIVAKIAKCLAVAHSHGVCHLDLKPENIIIDTKGEPRVIDFGLASIRDAWMVHVEEDAIQGTPPFMAPEQAKGKVTDHRTDIFGMGALLYFLLTGKAPFPGKNSAESVLKAEKCQVNHGALTRLEIPDALAKIVAKAMAPASIDRHKSAEALAAELEAFTHDLTVNRNLPSRRLVVTAIGGCLVLLGLASWRGLNPGLGDDPRNPETISMPSSAALDVLIWSPDDETRQQLSIYEPGALPLQPGDQIRVEASLDKPAFIYLFWIDAKGKASPLFPWEPGDWSQPTTASQPTTRISLPRQRGTAWPLEAISGMESVVMLVRQTPLPIPEGMQTLLADLPAIPIQNEGSVVWFVNGTTSRENTRSLRFDPERLDDPLINVQADLAEKLVDSGKFAMMYTAAFANAGQTKDQTSQDE